jgi:hypothetical protein
MGLSNQAFCVLSKGPVDSRSSFNYYDHHFERLRLTWDQAICQKLCMGLQPEQ